MISGKMNDLDIKTEEIARREFWQDGKTLREFRPSEEVFRCKPHCAGAARLGGVQGLRCAFDWALKTRFRLKTMNSEKNKERVNQWMTPHLTVA